MQFWCRQLIVIAILALARIAIWLIVVSGLVFGEGVREGGLEASGFTDLPAEFSLLCPFTNKMTRKLDQWVLLLSSYTFLRTLFLLPIH